MAMRQDASTGQLVSDGHDEPQAEIATVDGKPVMHLKVYSPFRVYFDDQAFSVSAENATGPFDILPRHHKFLSLLNPCELVVAAPSGAKRIRISGGLMQVQADKVKVFLNV
jgi:F0F1-type ATP synthase epsilon subunit